MAVSRNEKETVREHRQYPHSYAKRKQKNDMLFYVLFQLWELLLEDVILINDNKFNKWKN